MVLHQPVAWLLFGAAVLAVGWWLAHNLPQPLMTWLATPTDGAHYLLSHHVATRLRARAIKHHAIS